MELSWKSLGIYTVVVAALAVGVTKYYFPTIDTKITVQEKEVVRKDVQTVIKEIVKPDGTKETVTTIVDKSKESSTKKLEQIVTKKNDWFVAAGAEARLNDLNNPVYKIEANRRILGDVFVGATVNTQGAVGVQLGFTF